MSNLDVVVGAQFGSESKGACAAWLAAKHAAEGKAVTAVRVGGPNAGHTVIGSGSYAVARQYGAIMERLRAREDGDPPRWAYKLRQLPTAAVSCPDATLVIAAGSEIDWPVLFDEVRCLDANGLGVSRRLLIDAQATLIFDRHKEQEGGRNLIGRIGSTGKGVGAARAERAWRLPDVCLATNLEYRGLVQDTLGVQLVDDTSTMLYALLRRPDRAVIVEGTQGFGLGLHSGFYPYGTSGDCRAIDFLAQAGISPWQLSRTEPGDEFGVTSLDVLPELAVWLVVRPYPIRVAGDSGPLSGETNWAELGLPVERTTVTNKVRRVGAWDGGLVRRAVTANGGPPTVRAYLAMFDHIAPQTAGLTEFAAVQNDDAIREQVEWYQRECQCLIAALGTGPDTALVLPHHQQYQQPSAMSSSAPELG